MEKLTSKFSKSKSKEKSKTKTKDTSNQNNYNSLNIYKPSEDVQNKIITSKIQQSEDFNGHKINELSKKFESSEKKSENIQSYDEKDQKKELKLWKKPKKIKQLNALLSNSSSSKRVINCKLNLKEFRVSGL